MPAPSTPAEAREHFLRSTAQHSPKQFVTVPVSALRLACGATDAETPKADPPPPEPASPAAEESHKSRKSKN